MKNIVLQNENEIKVISGLPVFSKAVFPFVIEVNDMIIGYIQDPKELLDTDFYKSLTVANQQIFGEWQENDNPLIIVFRLQKPAL